MREAKNDPITGKPCYLLTWTVEEGGTWRYLMVDGEVNLEHKFNLLYAAQSTMVIRVFALIEGHRREIVKVWNKDV